MKQKRSSSNLKNRTKRIIIVMVLLLMVTYLTGCVVYDVKSDIYDNEVKLQGEGDSFRFKYQLFLDRKNGFSLDFNGFHGVKTVYSGDADGLLTADVIIKLKTGDFKLVLVTDGGIETVIDDSVDNTYVFEVDGKYVFKVVGRNARGSIVMDIKD